MHVFLYNKYGFKLDGPWVHLLASLFSHALSHGNHAVPFCIVATCCFEGAKDTFKQLEC